MKKPTKNVAASVHQRLLNLRDQGAASFDYLQTWFVLERLLYRLSKSKHSDQFILKGAMLFAVWTNQTIRPTRDLDLLGYGDDSADRLKQVFIDVCQTPAYRNLVRRGRAGRGRCDIDCCQGPETLKRASRPSSTCDLYVTVRLEIGRGDWIRTSDPLLPKQVRYRATLRPDRIMILASRREPHVRTWAARVRGR